MKEYLDKEVAKLLITCMADFDRAHVVLLSFACVAVVLVTR